MHRFRVPVTAIGEFLGLLDPNDSAIVTYHCGGPQFEEWYVVELDVQDDIVILAAANGVEKIN